MMVVREKDKLRNRITGKRKKDENTYQSLA